MNFEAIKDSPRLLIESRLRPLQGTRFQPTGFPDLGAADYQVGTTRMVLVESAQSMANRLEAVCWDEGADELVPALRGLPFVKSKLPDGTETNSILEAHRLNSPYIVNGKGFETIKESIGFEKDKPFNRRKLAAALMRFDPCSLVHGIFLEKIGGVVRLPRLLSAFIEAKNATIAPSGGVKIDRVQPATEGENTTYGKAKDGYGNVPFHRDEYAAESISAYFNIDLALLRGYGLGPAAEALLLGLSLYKIQKVLHEGMRLRTACDLAVIERAVTSPKDYVLPTLDDLENALPELIAQVGDLFSENPVLTVEYQKKGK